MRTLGLPMFCNIRLFFADVVHFFLNLIVSNSMSEMAIVARLSGVVAPPNGHLHWHAKLTLPLGRSPIATSRGSCSFSLGVREGSYLRCTCGAARTAASPADVPHAAMQRVAAAAGAPSSGPLPPQQQPAAPEEEEEEVFNAPIVAVSSLPAARSRAGTRARIILAPSFVWVLCCACVGLALAALLSPGHALAEVEAASNPVSGKTAGPSIKKIL